MPRILFGRSLCFCVWDGKCLWGWSIVDYLFGVVGDEVVKMVGWLEFGLFILGVRTTLLWSHNINFRKSWEVFNGSSQVGRYPLVSWDLVCRPKKECGLGIGRLVHTNTEYGLGWKVVMEIPLWNMGVMAWGIHEKYDSHRKFGTGGVMGVHPEGLWDRISFFAYVWAKVARVFHTYFLF